MKCVSDDKATAFFDGTCPLCSREIRFYRRLDRAGAIRWHDVSSDPGDLARDGVTQADAMARFHVRLTDGRYVTGVDAFIAVWRRLSWLRRLAPIAAFAPIHAVLERAYAWYASRRAQSRRRRFECPENECSAER